ncbi:hypothetical protein AhnVgp055 [Adoxophyes honmai nucleopolyhedrovirus]|uniref:Pif-6 n=1 Tax=Adoxophyes honmai nucleopolyhedrovirus TaxID=224399 RepID=Q80LP1_NPVAH|nr:hypothetical protein AhnVgp055 [Adoxophyes honmai nucleopolyhedrovirus]BAC67306.1 hypothetical protein [Adoxophyes honmai nucleopolyhedrovirus]
MFDKTVRWRILNTDKIEVVPDDLDTAWKNIIFKVIKDSPTYASYRTHINKANFENFDYKSPIIYELKTKQLLVTNEPLKKALSFKPPTLFNKILFDFSLNRLLLIFICSILLIIITFNQAHNNGQSQTAIEQI